MRKTTANKNLSNTILFTGLACFITSLFIGGNTPIYVMMAYSSLIFLPRYQRLVLKKA
ncbi:hypothetical protein [Pedobacter gandavensis]|uniref:hypothetical protein n=1 Tax=Pedobacter gandavensis TaxID=2679963 RepID=UPI0029303545|nr:hypothetical protein [Pedobacter gandavensis]